MDQKTTSKSPGGAVVRRLGLVVATGGLALLGAGAAPTASALGQGLHLTPIHLTGLTTARGHGGGGGGGGGGVPSVCWQSSNWSGYALSQTAFGSCLPASNTTYSSVGATWTVPKVVGSSGSTYSAVWTGIDGFTNSNLIQAGTEEDVISGRAEYYAWWEILPAAETVISNITVEAGDSITVSISHTAGTTSWVIDLTDNGQAGHAAQPTFTTTQSYKGSGTSAEWVVEAPALGGRISTLANYGSALFDHDTANGAPVDLPSGSGGEMVQGRGTVVSVPSQPDTGSPPGDGFAAAYGSQQPAAPTS